MTNAASDGGKGSGRRPGQGYQDAWERIFGDKKEGSAPTAPTVLPLARADREQQEHSVPHHPKGGGTVHAK